jgi:protein-tyrosine phosphatase
VHKVGWLDLDGVLNMRDLGGLPTVDGGSIRHGRLIRSDNLQELSPTAVTALLKDLGVTDVVDLRTIAEVEEEGDGPLRASPLVTFHHLTLYPDEARLPPADPQTRPRPAGTDAAGECVEPQSEQGHDQRWSEEYLTYLATRPDSVIAALRAIANSRGAAIVHCAAGKDRTGTIVGLALKVAGVTDEAIMADFAASAERVPLILARLSKRPAYRENLRGKTADSQSPRVDTMRRLLETLEARYNGAAGWLEQNGWTQEETERLRRKLRD